MLRKMPRAAWLAPPLAYLLYLYNLSGVGLLGPDEPRYASIAREMARSGDWITPRLWGQPWFEKPALLYWVEATAFRVGLGRDLAPRLPVALLAMAFLGFYWWILNREFGCRAAVIATAVLGTSGGFVVCSQAAVPDMPLTVTFSAAMLLALPWVVRRDARLLPLASAAMGFAVLAKGPLPLVLAAPIWLSRIGRPRELADLLRPRAVAPFLVVALPWYILCYLRNGREFLYTFFWQHNVERFTSPSLMHVQPWWYYLPVLAAGFLPWTALAPLAARRDVYRDARRLFLLGWFLCGLIFFSLSRNKLPGYLLPLLPAAAVLVALALDGAKPGRAGIWLACCALLLVAFPIASTLLPAAFESGLTHASFPAFRWTWLLPGVIAAGSWILEARGLRVVAVLVIAAGATAGTVYLKRTAQPMLDRSGSARLLWQEIGAHPSEVCVDNLNRNWRYGLNYYSVTPLPECSIEPLPLWLRQQGSERPSLTPAPRR